jgi:hypothetical protein
MSGDRISERLRGLVTVYQRLTGLVKVYERD